MYNHEDQATAKPNKLSNFTKKYGIVLILVLLVAAASILEPKFISGKNITNVLSPMRHQQHPCNRHDLRHHQRLH